MASQPPPASGVLSALQQLGAALLTTLQDRVELVAVELQEEKFRALKTFVWMCAAMVTGTLALIFASFTVLYLSWESARLPALLGMTLFYVVVTVALLLTLRNFLARQGQPFSSTIQQLREDRACMRTKN